MTLKEYKINTLYNFNFRYLATGSSFSSLHFEFMRGRSTIAKIVGDTTAIIWEVLQPIFMPIPTTTMWQEIADRYYTLYQLPNCMGSLDGKHFRIKKLPKSGSLYFNYKGFFSIVLMATADADGLFITVDVGEVGRNSDGGVFKHSTLGCALRENKLNLPEKNNLPNDQNDFEFPFYFAADEAFPLGENIIKPFPQKTLTNVKRIFNYRLSRGRKNIECAFGMLVSKFRVFETAICSKEETIINIIKAACVLHNFIRTREGRFTARNLESNSAQTDVSHLPDLELLPTAARNMSQAQINRNYLANYFIKNENALPWQWKYCV